MATFRPFDKIRNDPSGAPLLPACSIQRERRVSAEAAIHTRRRERLGLGRKPSISCAPLAAGAVDWRCSMNIIGILVLAEATDPVGA